MDMLDVRSELTRKAGATRATRRRRGGYTDEDSEGRRRERRYGEKNEELKNERSGEWLEKRRTPTTKTRRRCGS